MKPGLRKTLAVVLLAAVLLMINFIAARVPVRGDLTAGQIYTLSAGTRALLSKIEEPVTLQLYASRDASGLPTQFKNYADRVEEMLRAYVRASGGKLSLEVISPAPDTPEEERAQASGLQAQQIPLTGEPFYLGLVVTQADQQKAIPTFSAQREEFLEYDLSSLLHSVQQLNKPKLGLLTKLPLSAPPFNPMMMGQRTPPRGQIVHDEWARAFQIVPIQPGFTSLPADLAALAVLHPTGLTPAQEYALDQFILSGKPVLLAVDPSSTWFKRQGGQQAMYGGGSPDTASDLPRLLKAYGISYDPQQVVGDSRLATPIGLGNGQVSRMPVWLSLTAANLNASSPATAQLNSLLLAEPGSFTIDARTDREITPLLETSAVAGSVPGFTLQFAQPDEVARSLQPGTAKKTLAAIVRGPLATAFPEGQPADPAGADKTSAPASAAGLKTGAATLLLIADTDWLLDDFSVRRVPVFGQEMVEPLNDNLAFAANAVEFLAGSPDLIALRGKRSAQRPFEVVARMEADAQARYNDQLAGLETRLSEIQGKISALQGKSPDGGRLVATPEVLKTIEEFQAKELEMRRERRDIRRALREGIDALETRLLLLNLLATPTLLGVFGLWFARHRKKAA
ncbi:MAG: GldG family protein [Verrucomicrobia bacterium]|nr:GldG family protein [Verrucomicrobiota bacterium]